MKLTLPCLAVASLVFLGAGCLVDNEDVLIEPQVLETEHPVDLNNDGLYDFMVGPSFIGNDHGAPRPRYSVWGRAPQSRVAGIKRVVQGRDAEPELRLGRPAPLEAGVLLDDSLNATLSWRSHGIIEVADFAAKEGRYLGLRIVEGDTVQYGWMRISIDTSRTTKLGSHPVLLYDRSVAPPGTPVVTGAES